MATGQKRNDATAQGCSTTTEDSGTPDIMFNAMVHRQRKWGGTRGTCPPLETMPRHVCTRSGARVLVRFHGAAEPALKYSLKYALRYINHVPTGTIRASENVYNYMLLHCVVLPWLWYSYDHVLGYVCLHAHDTAKISLSKTACISNEGAPSHPCSKQLHPLMWLR